MNIVKANISAIKNIIRPWGRATRSEFWWVIAVLFGGLILVILIDEIVLSRFGQSSDLSAALGVLMIGPFFFWLILVLVTTIRRLHDMELSGWFSLLYLLSGIGFIILAVLCSQPGTFGPNKYGLDPLYDDSKNVGEVFE